eukprot:5647759-Amphidinium_carterae.1
MPEGSVLSVNVDLAAWSPSFERPRHMIRMLAILDLLHTEVPRRVLLAILEHLPMNHRNASPPTRVEGRGTAAYGFPMGWLPASDSIMHSSWIAAAVSDVVLEMRQTNSAASWEARRAIARWCCQIDDATVAL